MIVQNQNQGQIRFIADGLEDLAKFATQLHSRYLLRGIHPYGDTIFNMIQLRFLLAEIEQLEEESPDHLELLQIIKLAANEAIYARGYLRFSGD
jgi:hypothetical protein